MRSLPGVSPVSPKSKAGPEQTPPTDCSGPDSHRSRPLRGRPGLSRGSGDRATRRGLALTQRGAVRGRNGSQTGPEGLRLIKTEGAALNDPLWIKSSQLETQLTNPVSQEKTVNTSRTEEALCLGPRVSTRDSDYKAASLPGHSTQGLAAATAVQVQKSQKRHTTAEARAGVPTTRRHLL